MKVVLLSTYDNGHQPFGIASAAAWLSERGHEVHCIDVAVEPAALRAAAGAQLIALHLPMHTSARLAPRTISRVRLGNPDAHMAAFGVYAPPNERYLRSLGVSIIIGGGFEQALADVADRLDSHGEALSRSTTVPGALSRCLTPVRKGLPPLRKYARLITAPGESKVVGYTEASQGCPHPCRHCPVGVAYQGQVRIVDTHAVLEDIRQQVTAGARHITFGDANFLSNPAHALGACAETPCSAAWSVW